MRNKLIKNRFLLNIGYLLTSSLLAQDISGVQRLHFGTIDTTISVSSTGDTPFFLSGKKMYIVGMMDGTFPSDNNFSVERGIWIHPIKLLNSYGYTISEQGEMDWNLVHSKSFEHNFYTAKTHFSRNEFDITREDMVVENEQAVFSVLTITNKSTKPRKIGITFTSEIEIRPSWRAEQLEDGKDVIRIVEGKIAATDNQGALFIGSNRDAKSSLIKGKTANLEYCLEILPQSTVEIPFLIAGDFLSEGSCLNAKTKFYDLINKFDQLKNKKREIYENAIHEGVKFECSDKKLTNAFYCAKVNVVMGIRDSRPFHDDLFIGAGIPVYPRLFGTDFCFSAPGLISSGFTDISKRTLNSISNYTKLHLRSPHEVSSEGKLLGWDHIQVTPQFVATSWEYFVWTRDTTYLKSVYPLCEKIIDDVLKTADKDNDQYIEGHGLMEESDFKGDWEELTSSAYMYPALLSLSKMAKTLTEQEKASGYYRSAISFKERFNHDWWDNEQGVWASAITADGEKRLGNYWNITFPQKTGLADDEKGQRMMANIADKWVNNTWGMVGKYNPDEDQSNSGVGIVHNNICATAAFKYGNGDLAWKLLQLSTKGVFDIRVNQLGMFPECQPTTCGNISQLWSYGPFLETIIKGLAGINPVGINSDLEIYPFFPKELDCLSISDLKVGDNLVSFGWKRSHGKILLDIGSNKNEDLKISLRLSEDVIDQIILNGQKIDFKLQSYHGVTVGSCTFLLTTNGHISIED